jgi:hypothetical protein
LRVLVGDGCGQQIERINQPALPVREHARSRRTRVVVLCVQKPHEQIAVHHIEGLIGPQALQQMMLVLRVRRIQAAHPGRQHRQHLFAALLEHTLGPEPCPVLRCLQGF